MSKFILLSLVFALASVAVLAEGNISAFIQDGWIVASQGRDENFQSTRIEIWGSERIKGGFHQLDQDAEREYVVISRGTGSGPYYKLQIVDFVPNGILAWSYDSAGAPRIEDGMVWLGELKEGYDGAASAPRFRKFRLSESGLLEADGG